MLFLSCLSLGVHYKIKFLRGHYKWYLKWLPSKLAHISSAKFSCLLCSLQCFVFSHKFSLEWLLLLAMSTLFTKNHYWLNALPIKWAIWYLRSYLLSYVYHQPFRKVSKNEAFLRCFQVGIKFQSYWTVYASGKCDCVVAYKYILPTLTIAETSQSRKSNAVACHFQTSLPGSREIGADFK